ncbi:MAG: hypothetical protein JNK75_01815 [Betaproteobacteria bacterium]|nr:hypothetical protein [Betaproteobacteria bacterium]
MKRTDLEKIQGKQIAGQMRGSGIPDRFGRDSAAAVDKREQRRRDAEAGLIPFATKLPSALVQQLREKAEADKVPLNELVANLLEAGVSTKAKKKA